MPELPEVEHVVRALRRTILDRQIVASEIKLAKLIAPLKPSQFNRRLRGSRITGVERRGKFILILMERKGALPGSAGILSAKRAHALPQSRATVPVQKPARQQGLILAVHLRMTGKFLYLNSDDQLPKHSHAIFYLDNERRLVFRDQRKFGIMKLELTSRLHHTKGIVDLAPEPFSPEFSLTYLKDILGRSRRSLKTLLLDQTKVLGLGNIYAAEALFRARINPFKIADTLSSPRVARLHQAIRDVLSDAIADGSTSRVDLEHPDGFSYGEAFERFWRVYEREGEPCVNCGARIRRAVHGGRSTYWCPRCQRR